MPIRPNPSTPFERHLLRELVNARATIELLANALRSITEITLPRADQRIHDAEEECRKLRRDWNEWAARVETVVDATRTTMTAALLANDSARSLVRELPSWLN